MTSLFQRRFGGAEVEDRSEPGREHDERGAGNSQNDLIPAQELPSATEALANLFPEDDSTKITTTVEPPLSEPAVAAEETIPKPPRTILRRLFSSIRTRAKSVDKEIPVAPVAIAESPKVQEPAQQEVTEAGGADFAATSSTEEPPIWAGELSSAAHVLEEIFPDDPMPDESSTHTAEDAQVQLSAGASNTTADTSPIQQATSVVADECDAESPAEMESITGEQLPAPTSACEIDANSNSQPENVSLENEDHAQPEPVEAEPPQADEVATSSEDPDRSADQSKVPPEASAPSRPAYKDWALDDKLAGHREWVESNGVAGKKADLAGAELEATEMIGANLRFANLHDANLRSADLLLADLRDACLVRADLEDSCLVGANLEGANLEGASLETAMGLVPRQLAGANLRDALLAPQLMEFEAQTVFERESGKAYRYFAFITGACAFSALVIWETKDAQLLTDSSIFPFLHSRAAATALPTVESYLIVPVALFILYIVFNFHLQRLWDAVRELPAIFPDGHVLGDDQPTIIIALLRTHFRWMNFDASSTKTIERGVSILLAYWMVPVTLLLFWARDLTRQEIHGTVLQALLAIIAIGVAVYVTTKPGWSRDTWTPEPAWAKGALSKLRTVSPLRTAAVSGILLLLISVGTIAGAPHDSTRAPQYGAANIRRWAPTLLGWLGFDPYADLTEAALSTRPVSAVADDQVNSVDGARLNSARFRYAQAYAIFLANAHLWGADFQGAFMPEADLRGADLGQSNLRFAVLDQAHMYHANLDRANLDGADLRRADLRNANLSYCSLIKTVLVDARMDGASLYTSRLNEATLTRANLERVDLRDSDLGRAHLDHADFRGAYLWSAQLSGADLGGAQLANAIFIDANLQDANLGGAQMTGAVLNGANLRGTSLEGADMRGVFGLSANQVCSAKSRRGVFLDPDMQTQVNAQCGGGIHTP